MKKILTIVLSFLMMFSALNLAGCHKHSGVGKCECGFNFYDELRQVVLEKGSNSSGSIMLAETSSSSGGSTTTTAVFASLTNTNEMSFAGLFNYNRTEIFTTIEIPSDVSGVYSWHLKYESSYTNAEMKGVAVVKNVEYDNRLEYTWTNAKGNDIERLSERAAMEIDFISTSLDILFSNNGLVCRSKNFGF